MEYCVKCGISDSKALLFDVVSPEGIVKICRRCNLEEEFPLIKQAKKEPLIEKKKGVYERLSRYAGINPERHRKRLELEKEEEVLKKQEVSLRDIIDENFKKKIPEEENQEKSNLIHNFHWVVMRARRSKKMTQSQFAHEIYEPEEAVRTLEQGILPKDSEKLILKVENYLRINLRQIPKRSFEGDLTRESLKKQFEEKVSFDEFTTKNLTISDLKEMDSKGASFELKEQSQEEFLDPFYKDDKRKLKEETDLSDEEIERIIYGEQ